MKGRIVIREGLKEQRREGGKEGERGGGEK